LGVENCGGNVFCKTIVVFSKQLLRATIGSNVEARRLKSMCGGLINKIDKNVVYLLYNGISLLIGDSTHVSILSIMQFSDG
jgi:hypothetical protein